MIGLEKKIFVENCFKKFPKVMKLAIKVFNAQFHQPHIYRYTHTRTRKKCVYLTHSKVVTSG